ncbi:MAG: Yip1 family protein [Pseudomonadota bacterium]
MTADFGTFLRLFGETLKDPAAMARRIKALRWPHVVSWMALASITALSVIAIHLEGMLPGQPELAIIGGRPFVDAVLLGALTVILIFVLYWAGRAIGGTGTFGSTLLVMTWFQAVVLVMIAIQLIATLIMPGLSGFVALIAVVLQIYCLMHFLNELHDFDSLWKAAGLFILSVFGFAFGITLIVLLIGGASAVTGGAV